jgi:hypothetical protein
MYACMYACMYVWIAQGMVCNVGNLMSILAAFLLTKVVARMCGMHTHEYVSIHLQFDNEIMKHSIMHVCCVSCV